MSSIFLRIYGGLLFTLVLVAVLSGISVTLINDHRLGEYREDMVRGTFRLVSESLQELPEQERQAWLDEWAYRVAIPFSVVTVDQSGLSKKALEHMDRSGVSVQMLDNSRALVSTRLDQNRLLQGCVLNISEQIINGTLSLLREKLLRYAPAEREQRLQALAVGSFSYPVHLLKEAQARLLPVQQEELRQGSMLMLLDEEGQSISMYTSLPDTGQLLRLGPLRLLNPYPFKLMISIGLFMLTSISLAIYILVRGMEKRLRRLERAATRFSRGDFDVRVSIGGTDSIGRLASAFNAMAGYIQRLLSLKKEMIRGVSHELRTPVARLRFGLDLIADAETSEEREKQLEGMDKDIEELDNLVDEFLTYANLEQSAPEIRYKRHDVDKVVAQVVSEYGRLQDRVDIEHIPCNVLNPRRFADVDRRYIHRAIQNLIGNACRYADSKVQVRFSSTQETCRVDVDDDGPGIAEEEWDRVFSAFSRLDDSRTRNTGGYGLGLSIVRRIMYWHNGRAMVSHSPMGGARFSLVWPRKQRR
ncbi:ATP-binding protein [Endozoicomonas gorgoniicola]|uniref:histidine kinase n=1 Tax=Endozoicomonas gorgoniicola TaxID=1234144 RepID=A0ABT3MZ94_9GAMM|nr:ATP-binding protein [Endozoicomonas gorgoniicola]MCW7554706.1 ATP-binding protein [Endozoicomonas gorgoniicola]